jgi:hypothetical protein
MFSPTDQALLPLLSIRAGFVSPDSPTPSRSQSTRRSVRRPRPNIVRLVPGVTRLPLGYSPR